MKQRLVLGLLAGLTLAAPAAAQGYDAGMLPPHQIMRMLRSTGFDPIGRPEMRGPNYVLMALDRNDREVRVVVNARSGTVLSATPMQTASRLPPGGSMGEWQRMPPGYRPPPGPGGYDQRGYGPPVGYEDDEAPPPRAYGARPPAGVPGNSPQIDSARPQDDDDDMPSSSQSGPNVLHADPPQGGALPPPPERFPQRAVTPPPPKPVQRAAAPPKTTPLPKPKPAEGAPASSAPAQAAPAKPATPPAQAEPANETPI